MARVPVWSDSMAFNKWPQRPCESFSPWKTAGWKNLRFFTWCFFCFSKGNQNLKISESNLHFWIQYIYVQCGVPIKKCPSGNSVWPFWDGLSDRLSDLQLGEKVTTWITWQFCLFPKNKGKHPKKHQVWTTQNGSHLISKWFLHGIKMTLKKGKTHCLKRKHLKNGKENHLNSSKSLHHQKRGMEPETPQFAPHLPWQSIAPRKLSIHPTSGWPLDGYMVTHGLV